ncbi:MAG TPA: response regulator [Candidatus Limnocylindrales bacterium]|nr:response regulator [Candidatus Limnocylindrales bacterium]
MQKLLIIDDDEAVRKVLRFRLKDKYEIIDTGSPETALSLALKEKPDAILLDLMMPKYSGFEVCQTLSSLSFTQRIPIIIVSGESSSRYKDFCEALGAKDFVQKPVDFEALQMKITKLVEGSHNGNQGEPRVRLRVMLKLRSTDEAGAASDVLTVTETVSASGFLCAYQPPLKEGAVVEVYLAKNAQQFSGKARAIRVDWPGTPGQRADFQFLDKPSEWILR